MGSQNRPSKRSLPVSQVVLNNKDTNTMRVASTKTKDTAPEKGIHGLGSLFRTISEVQPLRKKQKEVDPPKKINATLLTKLVSTTPLKTLDSKPNNATKSSFKVFQDLPQLHETPSKFPASNGKKISELDLELNNSSSTIDNSVIAPVTPMSPHFQFDFSKSADSDSLLYKFQLPLYHLNNWYRINQYEILPSKDQDQEELVFVIEEISKFNEMITMVTIKVDGYERQVMLLNYRQSTIGFNKFQDLKKGDKVQLIEGLNLMKEYKMYHNWKLVN